MQFLLFSSTSYDLWDTVLAVLSLVIDILILGAKPQADCGEQE